MKHHDAITVLKRHKHQLRRLGVRRAAIFGSVARGEARADSDVDVLVELEPTARLTAFNLAGIYRTVAELFPGPVHVATADHLKPALRSAVLADAVYAF
jgi:uncharacterized protein